MQSKQAKSSWVKGTLFVLLNCGLVYHLLAIVVAPASVPPSSEAVRSLWGGFRHYLQATHFNHGYHYFSPAPGNSTLVRYVAKFPDGHVELGQIPDRDSQQPRLFYHRHLMLTEFLSTLPPESTELRDSIAESYGYKIAEELGASELELSLVTHNLIPHERVLAGGAIDDVETYEIEPLMVIERATK